MKEKMLYIFYLDTQKIEVEGEVIKTRSEKDTLYIFPDTVYALFSGSSGALNLVKSGINSNVTGIFYLYHSEGKYKVIAQEVDPYTVFDTQIYFYDIDHQEPKEVVSIWYHEGDIYYVRIDQIFENTKVKNLYISKDLGVPTIENGQIMTIKNDTLYFLYMLDDGSAHEKAFIKCDSIGGLNLQVIQKIPN